VPQILESDQLQAGNALVQGTAQLSLFLGPVLAGGLIALFGNSHQVAGENTPGANGIGAAFAIDALSFLASLWALWQMRICKPHTAAENQSGVLKSIREGLTYVWDSAVLRMLFLVMVAVNFLVIGPFEVGIPVMADTRLSAGAAAYGIILSAFGGGALIGIILAGVLPRPKPTRFGAVLLILTAYLGLGLVLLPLSSSIVIVALIALSIGITNGYVNITMVTWLQKRIPDALMGRIMSLMMFAGLGVGPISSMLAGALLDINLDGLFIGAGLLMAAVALATITVPVVQQMGLEVPESDQTLPVTDARRSTSDLPDLRSTHEMPVVKP
jgi:predicted MFS family arabinose efflux permease